MDNADVDSVPDADVEALLPRALPQGLAGMTSSAPSFVQHVGSSQGGSHGEAVQGAGMT